jgi:hypothetical protein
VHCLGEFAKLGQAAFAAEAILDAIMIDTVGRIVTHPHPTDRILHARRGRAGF